MTSVTQDFGAYHGIPSSTSGATTLMIMQILAELQILKNCRGGWKALTDNAKEEVVVLRNRILQEHVRFQQMEQDYIFKMAALRRRMHEVYNEKHSIRNILENTVSQLQTLQYQSKHLVLNFTSEKEKVMKVLNEKDRYIITNNEFLKNVSKELRHILNNTLVEKIVIKRNESLFQIEIRYYLTELAKFVQNIKKELLEKVDKMTEVSEKYKLLVEENVNCESSKEEMQEELNEAKALEEDLQKIRKEKVQLENVNENQLKHILSILNTTTVHNNATLDTILKQTSLASRGIQKYIVEPAETAANLTIKSILKNRTKEDALLSAAKNGNVTEMSLLLDYGVDIETEDKTNILRYKPLHWVSDKAHLPATRLLLLRGADVDATSGYHNITALHVAVNQNNRNIIDFLLKGGADIEVRDEFGSTPLFWAAIKDCKTAKLLVDRGASVSTVNYNNITAVSRATECVKDLLCSNGATDQRCSKEDEYTTTALPST